MKFVVISDTHGDHRKLELPAGDVIIHAGDLSAHGKKSEVIEFLAWFDSLPYQYKVLVAGNHDWFIESSPIEFATLIASTSIHYLNDSGVTLDGIELWGSPITTEFYDWAFQRKPGAEIRQHWDKIPVTTDILVTHSPPHGIMDEVPRDENWEARGNDSRYVHAGCAELLERVWEVSPSFHLFGHIHEGYGHQQLRNIHFINAASMDGAYRIKNQPVVFDFEQSSA